LENSSTLFIIPTPIGNLEDITLRALTILKQVDKILAEDTRQSIKLLKHFNIQTTLQSYHQFNEHKICNQLVKELQSGKNIGLISDAGTPAISDPGFLLIRECIKNNIAVNCLPGATAFVPALVKSGIPCNQFTFLGFLPEKKGKQSALKLIADSIYTTVIYESPHRLIKTLEQLQEQCSSNRLVSISREISKIYEESITCTIDQAINYFNNKAIKGEFVIVIEGKK